MGKTVGSQKQQKKKKKSATLSILVTITENKQQTRKTHFINMEV